MQSYKHQVVQSYTKVGRSLSSLEKLTNLEEIDNLTPKKAEELLKNLDVLCEKIKEKAIIENVNAGSMRMIDDALRAEDDNVVANAIANANSAGVQATQSVGTVVAETVSEMMGDANPVVEISSKNLKERGSEIKEAEGTVANPPANEDEQPWITVRTRSKAQARNDGN
ncbi:hypothetical protein RIF29_10857 [Crotalaria pallida]|uniref:Uncharacterized protein n=1 Tax=Crotalaria pallida TaxID=3830 RepID=A0AAN9IIL5_CROPI